MTARQLVVVDVESSGLREADLTVEVAWRNVDTGERGEFVPAHNTAWVLRFGQPTALEMNGYRERLLEAPQDDGTEVARLHTALTGNCLAGSNPGFDWYMHLSRLFRRHRLGQPHHHRMPDISNYAAGVLGIDPRELPGLARVCELLGVEAPDHTAAGDVRATGECFDALSVMAKNGRYHVIETRGVVQT